MNAKDTNAKVEEICDLLGKDSVLRAAVIRSLARDYPKDFLAPVKVDKEFLEKSLLSNVVSDKEWQE